MTALAMSTAGSTPRPEGRRAAQTSERSCVVCRKTRPPGELVGLRLVEEQVVVGGEGSGRGAWVCLERGCLEAVTVKQLARAFRRSVTLTPSVVEQGHRLAERKLYELIGLARRQGTLDVGTERLEVVREKDGEAAGVWILATDVSERNRRRLGPKARLFGDAEKLGQASGLGRVGALRLRPGALAKQAAYWLHVWYETAPSGLNEVDDG